MAARYPSQVLEIKMWMFWGAVTQPAIVRDVVSYTAFKDTRRQGNVRELAPNTVKFNQRGRVDRTRPGRDVSFLSSLWMTAPRRGFPLQPVQRHPTWTHTRPSWATGQVYGGPSGSSGWHGNTSLGITSHAPLPHPLSLQPWNCTSQSTTSSSQP